MRNRLEFESFKHGRLTEAVSDNEPLTRETKDSFPNLDQHWRISLHHFFWIGLDRQIVTIDVRDSVYFVAELAERNGQSARRLLFLAHQVGGRDVEEP